MNFPPVVLSSGIAAATCADNGYLQILLSAVCRPMEYINIVVFLLTTAVPLRGVSCHRLA